MQCREVEVVLAQEGFVPVPEAARAHLSGCSSCRSLIADLTDIVATAHLLPAEVEPPARLREIPYNYTCKPSWFYPGYYCYQAGPYDVPGHDAYGSSYSCPAAVWNGRQWVRREVC